MTFISQKKAIKQLKEATGFSVATCTAAVKAMPKRKDGCREKVHTLSLQEHINWVNRVKSEAKTAGVQLSRRTKARIRASVQI